jgi:ribonuclease R
MAKEPKPGRKSKAAAKGALPTKEQVLAFIADNPGRAGKREIARAFNLSGAAKIELKALLKDLAEDGLVTGRRRRYAKRGELPALTVLSVTGRDADGDLLAAPAEWDEEAGDAPQILLTIGARRPPGAAPGVGDQVLARIAPREDGDEAYRATIVKVLERRPETVLGVFRSVPGGGRIVPVDRKQRELNVAADGVGGAKPDDLVSAEVLASARLGPGRARVVEVLGSMKSEKAVSRIAIHAHGIPHVFPKEALAEAKAAKPAPMEHREDWRDLPLVTIDPVDAKDHDDAVHATADTSPANPGGFVVTVAIADVSWYVRPGSPLDREARKRGNSVYFPDQVVPMLPERISNDLCSLREGEDRPALAVQMIFSADGHKRSHRFERIMMRSAAKLSYQEAQAAFDGQAGTKAMPLMDSALRPLWNAYEALRRGRESRAPLDLDLPERKVILKKDGTIDRILVPERLEAHRLIEEFMIQANVATAETLEKVKSPLVYRIHDAPSLTKLEALREFLGSIDISLPKAGNLRPSHFNVVLARVRDSEHEQLVNEIVLRTQAQAEYSPLNIGHFGLNLRRYAHFTSPIRRYADLIVHRALVGSLKLGPGGLPEDAEVELGVISAEISAAERRAMAAERETIDRLVAHWLADRVGATFNGRIAGVTRAGLFVKLNETGADGFVPISSLGNEYFRYDEARHAVVGTRSGEMHQLGDPVEVRLLEVAPLAGALRFELLSEGRVLPAAQRGRTDRRERGRRGGAKPERREKPKRGRR